MLIRRVRSSSRITLLLILFAGLGGAALRGQPASLVRDINPGPASSFDSFDGFDTDGNFVPLSIEHEGLLLFGADDGVSGRELWRSDGTAEGTFLVQDLVPGPFSSHFAWMTPFDGSVVFAAGLSANFLWRTDGTPEGTESFGPSDLHAWEPTPFEGSLLFHGWTHEFGSEPLEERRHHGRNDGCERHRPGRR